MAKLHELLAANSNLTGQAQKTRTDLAALFNGKKHHFSKKLVTFIPLAEGQPPVTKEQSEIQSTVKQEIDWVSEIIAKAIDSSYSIDVANTFATADIVLDGNVLAKAVPATALLQLEKRVKEISDLIKTIPTLDPAKGFKADPDQGKGWYVARDIVTDSTKKEQRPLVLYPHSDKHPAQVQLVSEDIKVGENRTQEWSTMITPAVKAKLIDRAESLFRAVTQARSRANDTAVDTATTKIGEHLLGYIFKPLNEEAA